MKYFIVLAVIFTVSGCGDDAVKTAQVSVRNVGTTTIYGISIGAVNFLDGSTGLTPGSSTDYKEVPVGELGFVSASEADSDVYDSIAVVIKECKQTVHAGVSPITSQCD